MKNFDLKKTILFVPNDNLNNKFSGTIRETDEKSAYANDACDVEDKGCDAPKSINKDKMTMIDSFKLKRKMEDSGTQKAYSMEFLNEVEGKVGVQLRGVDIGGLGFNIQGNMNEGIFVKEIISKGIAEQCGNILVGDKIKSLTINFENMVYEDAVTLLSYSSPYKVSSQRYSYSCIINSYSGEARA